MLRSSNYTLYCVKQSDAVTSDNASVELLLQHPTYVPYHGRATSGYIDTMSGDQAGLEKRISYGIGGHGNLRRKSDVQMAEQMVQKLNDAERRRSSVVSMQSEEGSKRGSFVKKVVGMFGGGGKKGPETAVVEE